MSADIILGRRRQGKSTLAIRRALSLSRTVVIFDPNTQYKNFPASTISEIEDQMRATCDQEEEWENAPAENRGPQPGPWVFRYVPREPEKDFGPFADMLWYNFEDYAVIVDECSTVQTSSKIHPALERWLRRSTENVHVIQTTHRPQDLYGLSKGQSTDVFIFSTTQVRELKAIGEMWDDDLPAIVQRLPLFALCHFWLTLGGVKQISIWYDSKVWYIDIGRGESLAAPDYEPTAQPSLIKIEGDVKQSEDPAARRIKAE